MRSSLHQTLVPDQFPRYSGAVGLFRSKLLKAFGRVIRQPREFPSATAIFHYTDSDDYPKWPDIGLGNKLIVETEFAGLE